MIFLIERLQSKIGILSEVTRSRHPISRGIFQIDTEKASPVRLVTFCQTFSQRLGELASSPDPISRGFAQMARKELSDAGASFPSREYPEPIAAPTPALGHFNLCVSTLPSLLASRLSVFALMLEMNS